MKELDSKTKNAMEARSMDLVLSLFNNEEAYASWLGTWPDDLADEDVPCYFGEDEDFNELKTEYLKIFKHYYKDGLFSREAFPLELLEYAQKTLEELGIKEHFCRDMGRYGGKWFYFLPEPLEAQLVATNPSNT